MRHSLLACIWRQEGGLWGGAVCQVGAVSPLLAMWSCRLPPREEGSRRRRTNRPKPARQTWKQVPLGSPLVKIARAAKMDSVKTETRTQSRGTVNEARPEDGGCGGRRGY